MPAVTLSVYGSCGRMLDDLDSADNLALLSHNHQQMQEKTSDLHHTSMQVGLTLNNQKTKIMRINAGTDEPVKIEGEELEEVSRHCNGQKWGNRRGCIN